MKQEEVRPLCATWSRGNRIHQSHTLSCHFPQSSRRQRGALLNLTDLLDWLQKHHTSRTLGKKKPILLDKRKPIYVEKKLKRNLTNIIQSIVRPTVERKPLQLARRKSTRRQSLSHNDHESINATIDSSVHFNWVQLCQDMPWLIEHISGGTEANRRKI